MTSPAYLACLAGAIFLAADGLVRLGDLAISKPDRTGRLRPAAEALIGALWLAVLL